MVNAFIFIAIPIAVVPSYCNDCVIYDRVGS